MLRGSDSGEVTEERRWERVEGGGLSGSKGGLGGGGVRGGGIVGR